MEVERSTSFVAEGFPRKGFRMQLDDLEEHYINVDTGGGDSSYQPHQADAANITLDDDLGPMAEQGGAYKRFERFDIEGDDDSQISITPMDKKTADQINLSYFSPIMEHPAEGAERTGDTPAEELEGNREPESSVKRVDMNDLRPGKRKGRSRFRPVAMDSGLLIIPAEDFHTWLQDTHDTVSTRPRQTKKHNSKQLIEISERMIIPTISILSSGLDPTTRRLHYPPQLVKNFRDGETPPRRQPGRVGDMPSPSRTQGVAGYDVGFDVHGDERGSRTFDASIEKLRANLENVDFHGAAETLLTDAFATPGSSGRSARSGPGSGSGDISFLPLEPEIRLASTRSKKRQHSSSQNSLGNLDPVEEDAPLEPHTREIKLRKFSGKDKTPEEDFNGTQLLEETAPAQTPTPAMSDPTVDKITQSIRTHLKTHFDTPGAPPYESLNMLALGMTRKRAAQLFYQTCVLATCDFVRVQQLAPYADIAISRGSKM
ncbi:rad21/Rec8-like family protein isoform X2 [Wolffia australiana]